MLLVIRRMGLEVMAHHRPSRVVSFKIALHVYHLINRDVSFQRLYLLSRQRGWGLEHTGREYALLGRR